MCNWYKQYKRGMLFLWLLSVVDVVVFAVLVVILVVVHILLTNEIHFVSMKVSNAITDMLIKDFLKDCGIYWYFFVNPSFKYFYEMSKYLEIQKYTSMNPFYCGIYGSFLLIQV